MHLRTLIHVASLVAITGCATKMPCQEFSPEVGVDFPFNRLQSCLSKAEFNSLSSPFFVAKAYVEDLSCDSTDAKMRARLGAKLGSLSQARREPAAMLSEALEIARTYQDEGKGCSEDATALLYEAAEGGDGEAAFIAGEVASRGYHLGICGEINLDRALAYFIAAAEGGHAQSNLVLSRIALAISAPRLFQESPVSVSGGKPSHYAAFSMMDSAARLQDAERYVFRALRRGVTSALELLRWGTENGIFNQDDTHSVDVWRIYVDLFNGSSYDAHSAIGEGIFERNCKSLTKITEDLAEPLLSEAVVSESSYKKCVVRSAVVRRSACISKSQLIEIADAIDQL